MSKGIVYTYYEKFFDHLKDPKKDSYPDFSKSEKQTLGSLLPKHASNYIPETYIFRTFFNCYKFFKKPDVEKITQNLTPEYVTDFQDAMNTIKNTGPTEYRMKQFLGNTTKEIIKSFEENSVQREKILENIRKDELILMQEIFTSSNVATIQNSFPIIRQLYRGVDIIKSLQPSDMLLSLEHYTEIKNGLSGYILSNKEIPPQKKPKKTTGFIDTGRNIFSSLFTVDESPQSPQSPRTVLQSFPAITLGIYDETFLIKT